MRSIDCEVRVDGKDIVLLVSLVAHEDVSIVSYQREGGGLPFVVMGVELEDWVEEIKANIKHLREFAYHLIGRDEWIRMRVMSALADVHNS